MENQQVEDESIRQKRHDVAEAFFVQYIDVGGVESDQVIDVIAELISYGGNLDQITQMMALELSDDGDEYPGNEAANEWATDHQE